MSSFIDLRASKVKQSSQESSANKREITILKPNKRLEGHDQYRLKSDTKNDKFQNRNPSDFKKNLKRIQEQTSEKNIEEEYINGLQDEIKYLEYELKLIKDKEIEQKASMNQLDHFFSDGVPVNDNILAIKNQFKNTKSEGEMNLRKNEEEEFKKRRINEEIKTDINKLNEYFEVLKKEIADKEAKFATALEDARKSYFENHQLSNYSDVDYKNTQAKIRKMQDKILTYVRAAEKEDVFAGRQEETKMQSMALLKQNIVEKEKKIAELSRELEELKGNEIVNPGVMRLEKENSEIVKKLMIIEQNINTAKSRCTDMQYLLNMRAEERLNEAQQKRDMNMKLLSLQLQLKEENNIKEKVLQQKALEKEKMDIQEIKKKTDNLKNLIDLYKKRIARCERENESLIEEKMETYQQTLEEEQAKESFIKNLDELKEIYKNIVIEKEIYDIKGKENRAELIPIQKSIDEANNSIPEYEKENERLKELIDHYEKQIELSSFLKQFNLEELKLISANSNQVNSKILDFIQNFENVQRMNKFRKN